MTILIMRPYTCQVMSIISMLCPIIGQSAHSLSLKNVGNSIALCNCEAGPQSGTCSQKRF